MRKILLSLLLVLASFPAPALAAPATQGSPGEVIALINSYRAENGLPAYQQNPILMTIAQGQADYLASIVQSGDVHAGPGGSRPRDRAYAAGYGDGAQFFLSEIGKYGLGETSESAIAWWKQSPDHNPTMIASTYVEIGCGVATDGNGRYYFICDTGYIVGGSYVASSGSTSGQTAQQPAGPVMIPVTKAEPQPDGSIVHIIRTGQTLWTLSAVYEVPLQQILTLNNFSESQIIHPGDEVIVAPAGSAPTIAPTEDLESTEEPSPTPMQGATNTPRPTSEQLAAVQPTADQNQILAEAEALQEAQTKNSTVKLVVGIALISILGVIAASFFIQRPHDPEPPENDPFAPL